MFIKISLIAQENSLKTDYMISHHTKFSSDENLTSGDCFISDIATISSVAWKAVWIQGSTWLRHTTPTECKQPSISLCLPIVLEKERMDLCKRNTNYFVQDLNFVCTFSCELWQWSGNFTFHRVLEQKLQHSIQINHISMTIPHDRSSIIWTFYPTVKIKRDLFQVVAKSILSLHHLDSKECLRKNLDGNHTRMSSTVLSKFWKRYPIKQQPYGHLPPIAQTIQVKRTRRVGHNWISMDKFISNVLL